VTHIRGSGLQSRPQKSHVVLGVVLGFGCVPATMSPDLQQHRTLATDGVSSRNRVPRARKYLKVPIAWEPLGQRDRHQWSSRPTPEGEEGVDSRCSTSLCPWVRPVENFLLLNMSTLLYFAREIREKSSIGNRLRLAGGGRREITGASTALDHSPVAGGRPDSNAPQPIPTPKEHFS
jgi:hypothetical protein